MPVYGGTALLDIHAIKSIAKGDSANVFGFLLQNHWGTHIDCPAHFFEDGRKVTDYPPEFWLFRNPQVIEVSLKPNELLQYNRWTEYINPETDILLFKSGWYKLRNREIYSFENPGIHPEVGFFLREKYPAIRAVGIDWISLSPYKDRHIGREAHKAFLNHNGINNPILVIEDMDLSHDMKGLQELRTIPLLIDMLDSAPCTVIGLFND